MKNGRGLTWFLTAAALAALVAGAQRQAAAQAADTGAASQSQDLGQDPAIDPNQPLKQDFTVNLSVSGEPDTSGSYRVDSSGNLDVRCGGLVLPVAVVGLTPPKAADAVRDALKKYLRDPIVTLTILQVPRPVVFIGGAVRNGGLIIISNGTTLVDALSRAEWLDGADLSQVRITRHTDVNGTDQVSTIVAHLDRYLKPDSGAKADDSQNPVLMNKDRILVPLKTLATGNVSIMGEVNKPSQGVALRSVPPMTVRELVNVAGGATPLANKKAVLIRRQGLDKPLVIDLDKAEAGDPINDIELKPDDVVYLQKLDTDGYVTVNGALARPGKVVWKEHMTLSQAISEAGGVTPLAREKDGRVFRKPEQTSAALKIVNFNWRDIAQGRKPDLELQPGDTVFIPASNQANPPFNIFSAMQLLSSGFYIINSIAGRGGGGIF